MKRVIECAFGATAQIVVGAVMIAITAFQTVWWLWISPPTVKVVFIVSMEALFFAAYGIMATGLSVHWLDDRTPDG